ncbi:MAG: multinuclear nonheme iron-dependent oxidase [Planktomarina sp.]
MIHFSFQRLGLPNLGCGLPLGQCHMPHVARHGAEVDWCEIDADDVLGMDDVSSLKSIRRQTPFTLACYDQNVFDDVDVVYFENLKNIADEFSAKWVSMTAFAEGAFVSKSALSQVVQNVERIQDILERPVILKNLEALPQQTLAYKFAASVSDATGCGLSVDVNALYQNCSSYGADAKAALEALPSERVVQVNLSGPTQCGRFATDLFAPEENDVWAVYAALVQKTGPVSTLLDWGNAVPAYPIMADEVFKTKHAMIGVFDGSDTSLLPADQIFADSSPRFVA